MDPNSLTHYGVKGMKWGVRRTPAQLGHRTSSRKKGGAAAAIGNAGKAAAKTVAGVKKARRDKIVGKAMASDASAKDIRKALPHMTDAEIQRKMDRNALEKRLVSSTTEHKQATSELGKTVQAIKKGSDLGDTEGVKKAKSKFVEESLQPIATAAGKAAGQQVLSKSAEVLTKVAAKKIGIDDETATAVAEIFKETMFTEDFAAAAKTQRDKFTEKNTLGDEWAKAKQEARNSVSTKTSDAGDRDQQKASDARRAADREAAAYRAGAKAGAKAAKKEYKAGVKAGKKAGREEARRRKKAARSTSSANTTALARTNTSWVDSNTTYEW